MKPLLYALFTLLGFYALGVYQTHLWHPGQWEVGLLILLGVPATGVAGFVWSYLECYKRERR